MIVFLFSCQNSRLVFEGSVVYNQQINFVEITDTFSMKVISFIISTPCGNQANASSCIGVTMSYDTIRVFTLCNTEDTFEADDIVFVTPMKKPIYYVGIPHYIIFDENNDAYLDPEILKMKTIFGDLKKKEQPLF